MLKTSHIAIIPDRPRLMIHNPIPATEQWMTLAPGVHHCATTDCPRNRRLHPTQAGMAIIKCLITVTISAGTAMRDRVSRGLAEVHRSEATRSILTYLTTPLGETETACHFGGTNTFHREETMIFGGTMDPLMAEMIGQGMMTAGHRPLQEEVRAPMTVGDEAEVRG